jgi:hypothetical protein
MHQMPWANGEAYYHAEVDAMERSAYDAEVVQNELEHKQSEIAPTMLSAAHS